MKIVINGDISETACSNLAELLASLQHRPDSVATARNGEFVAASKRDTTMLCEGDSIEIIAPMSGG